MSTRLRASSLPDLLDCPARWEAVHLLGRRKESSSRAILGQCIHDATAFYDTETGLLQHNADTALAASVERFHEKFSSRKSEWKSDKKNTLPFSKADKIGHQLVTLYALEISPNFHWSAVELTFQDYPVQVGSHVLLLTGTCDRIYQTPAGHGLLDLKSGKSRVSSDGEVKVAGDKPQLGIYELLAESKLGLPITEPALVAGLDTEKGTAAISEPIPGARDLVAGTAERPGLLQAVASYLESGIFPPNPKSQLCSEQYCSNYAHCLAHN